MLSFRLMKELFILQLKVEGCGEFPEKAGCK